MCISNFRNSGGIDLSAWNLIVLCHTSSLDEHIFFRYMWYLNVSHTIEHFYKTWHKCLCLWGGYCAFKHIGLLDKRSKTIPGNGSGVMQTTYYNAGLIGFRLVVIFISYYDWIISHLYTVFICCMMSVDRVSNACYHIVYWVIQNSQFKLIAQTTGIIHQN